MAARKIRNTWWVDFRFNHDRHRIRSPENSRAGALAYEALLRHRLARGESLQSSADPPPKFKTFAWRWYRTYAVANNRLSEQKNKRSALKLHLLPYFARYRIDKVPTERIEEFKAAKVKAGFSPKSVNNFLAILGRCLRDAQEWIGFQSMPKIKPLKVPPQKFDYLSEEEAQVLLASTPDERWRAMVLVALKAGLRVGELKGLQWSDIDFIHGHLTVRRGVVRGRVGAPKNNKERQVPFTSDVRLALSSLVRSSDYVFGRRGDGPLNHKTPENAIREFCKRAGLRRIGWHTLRHTYASQLAMKGVSLRAIQELLGHSHITTTMRYAHLAPSTLRQAVAVLEPTSEPDWGQTFGQQAVNTGLVSVEQKQKSPDLRGDCDQSLGWGGRI